MASDNGDARIYQRTNGIRPSNAKDRNYIRHGEFFLTMMTIWKSKVNDNTLPDKYRYLSTIIESMNRDNYRIDFKHVMDAFGFIRPHIYSESTETGNRADVAKPQIREELKYEIVKSIRLLFANLDNANFLRVHREFHGRFVVLLHAIYFVTLNKVFSNKYNRITKYLLLNSREECLLCISEMLRSPSMSALRSPQLTADPLLINSYNVSTPMILSNLQNSFACDCTRNGRNIQQKSIQLYGDIVRVMFNDAIDDPTCKKWIEKSIGQIRIDRLQVFLSSTIERVVKVQLIDTCSQLLIECAVTLHQQVPYLIEILVILSEDDDQQVIAKKANTIIDKYSHEIHWRTGHLLWDKFEELIVNLPALLKDATSDSEQILHIVRILGYCKVLKDSVYRGHAVSESLTNSLLLSAKMVSKSFLMEEMSTLSEDLKQRLTYEQLLEKRFEYLQNGKTVRQFVRIAGYYCSNRTLFESFFNILFDRILDDCDDFEKSQRNEAFFLISCLFENLSESAIIAHQQPIVRLVKEFFERIFTDDLHWYLPIEASKCGNNVRRVRYNMQTYAVRLETIAIIVRKLKKTVQRFVQPYYFMIFEQAGSNLAQISRSGIFALNELASSFGYENVRELLNENANFVLSLLKQRLEWDPELTFALNGIYVLTKFNVLKMSNYLFYLMHDILMHSFDRYGFERQSLAYLKVFNIILESVTIETLAKLIATDTVPKSRNFSVDDDQESERKPLPMHIRIIEKIVRKSINFLPSRNKRNCCIYALTIVRKSFELIESYPDILLPLVHKTWSAFVPRFDNFHDHVILLYSFRLLETMAAVSKDFIRLRTSQSVWSKLCDLVKVLAKDPSKSVTEPKYKLQVAVIDGLAKLIIALDVTDADLVTAIGALKYFLCENIPKQLQNKTRLSFIELMQFNEKIIHEHLLEIQQSSNFAKNCQLIFDQLKNN